MLDYGAIIDNNTGNIVNYDELVEKWVNSYNSSAMDDEAND